MNIMKLCLVVVLIFWLITELAPEDISAITSMVGIAVAVVAVILLNRWYNTHKGQDEMADEEDDGGELKKD